MARKIKWQIQWKSFLGNTCTIRIYKEGYNGGVVDASIKPSTNPFVVKIQDDDDIFKPVRLQSGYIRLVCTDSSWRDLIPQTNYDHQVRFYVGKNLKWIGYMKAEMYEHSMYNGVDEYEFPVICPLSLLENQYLYDEYATDQSGIYVDPDTGVSTFRTILSEILDKTGIDYCVLFSNYFRGDEYLEARISRMLYLENDDSFMTDKNKLFKNTKSCLEILEDYCTFWGFQCTMNGNEVQFNTLDSQGQDVGYIRYQGAQEFKEGISTHVTESIRQLTEKIVDNKSQEKILPPKSLVSVVADASISDIDMILPSVEDMIKQGFTVTGVTSTYSGSGDDRTCNATRHVKGKEVTKEAYILNEIYAFNNAVYTFTVWDIEKIDPDDPYADDFGDMEEGPDYDGPDYDYDYE